MSLENATMAAIVLIILSVGARILTSALLTSRRKDLSEITSALRTARAELGFAKERTKAAEDVISFGVRQKKELIEQIEYVKEDLKIREVEAQAENKDSPMESGEPIKVKLPRHMRPREE